MFGVLPTVKEKKKKCPSSPYGPADAVSKRGALNGPSMSLKDNARKMRECSTRSAKMHEILKAKKPLPTRLALQYIGVWW